MKFQMREHVWEWLLPGGLSVRAAYDPERDVESVWVGERLVARGRGGRRPDGHLVSVGAYQAVAVRVRFDSAERCTLYRGWDAVAPHTSPARRRARWKPIVLVSSIVVGLSIAAAAFLVLQEPEPAKRATPVAVSPNAKVARAGASAAAAPAPRPQAPAGPKAINPAPRAIKPLQFVTAPPAQRPSPAPTAGTAGTQRTARAVF